MIDLRDLSLAEAESQLVGAVIDHEHAMTLALARLPRDPFRSYRAEALSFLFYTCVCWYYDGTYDAWENRYRLEPLFHHLCERRGLCVSEADVWCPWGAVPAYVEALIDALIKSKRLEDDAVAAVRRLAAEYPLSRFLEPLDAAPAAASWPRRKVLGGVPV